MVEYDGLCCMIEITVGSKVTYEDGRIGTVEQIVLTPDGWRNPGLVAIVKVFFPETNTTVVATSHNFKPTLNEKYNELYPSSMLGD
jgi:hypothetical protein